MERVDRLELVVTHGHPDQRISGVPTRAASYAADQDQAPRALRAAGLLTMLSDAGIDVEDAGDLTEQVWAPDREQPYAQNLDHVVASVRIDRHFDMNTPDTTCRAAGRG